jgi:hypothetical protein
VGDFRFKEVKGLGINKRNSGKYCNIPPGKALEGTSILCITYSLELTHFGIDKIIAMIWKRKHTSEDLNFNCCLCWTSQFTCISYDFGVLSNK